MYRDHTKVVQIGNKKIGGGNPILIQSMTNTQKDWRRQPDFNPVHDKYKN